MKRLILRENRAHPTLSLTSEEAVGLASFSPKIGVARTMLGETFDVTTTSWIGAIEVGSVAIEIQPKLPISRVLFLIGYALDPKGWRDTEFDYRSDRTLMEAIAPGFVSMLRRALARGILQGYRSEEAALQTVRGRIRFGDQIRRHFGKFPPAEVTYDEFTEDIQENRLLRAALHRVGSLRIRSREVRRALRVLDSVFRNVSHVNYDPRQVPEIYFNRLNEHYRVPIRLARLILQGSSIQHRHADHRSAAFLVNMNRVFENFVAIALREALGATSHSFPQNARGRRLYLDEDARVRLEPDLSWWHGNRCVFVGDVKYKGIAGLTVIHSDVYQLLAYTTATRLRRGTLIYAEGEAEDVVHRVANSGTFLEVRTLDLTGAPLDILAQIERLAEGVQARIDDEHRRVVGQTARHQVHAGHHA